MRTGIRIIGREKRELWLFSLFLLFLFSHSLFAQERIKIWKGTSLQRKRVTMEVYQPQEQPLAAVIVCPGGSYCWHDWDTEGVDVAKWLQQEGFVAYVLKYRVQGVPAYITHSRLIFRGKQHPDMIEDLQRALQIVREKWAEKGLAVGVMGFSAGGHLAMNGAELAHSDFLAPHGISCKEDLRPDFIASIYPVVSLSHPCSHKRSRRALLGEYRKYRSTMRDSLSLELHVPDDCPPVFLINCADDPVVHPHNSELLDSALTAHNIPHRYIRYQTGGHGFGASTTKGTPESRQWKQSFLYWVKNVLKI